MSTMRLILFAGLCLLHYCYSNNSDLLFQIQPQSILINNLDEKYITHDQHYIGQVLYRYDRIELACDCQTQLNDTDYYIYWTINDRIFNRFNNSNSIRLLIEKQTVEVPITYVTCYCVFHSINSTRRISKDYQYQLYIDLESEPSLKPIEYSIQSSIFKEHLSSFIQHHFLIIPILFVLIIVITCLVIILSFTR